MLPGKSHQSPSRQQRPADPRRESTVLFKGFTASTAETGLLEVEEIAEINGSPELMRASHSSVSATKPETPDPPAASQSHAASGVRQAISAVDQLVNYDAEAVCCEIAPSSNADVETADHQHVASSSQACSAPAPEVELQAQQSSVGQSQSIVARAEESQLQAGPAVKLQVCMQMCVCALCVDSQLFSRCTKYRPDTKFVCNLAVLCTVAHVCMQILCPYVLTSQSLSHVLLLLGSNTLGLC